MNTLASLRSITASALARVIACPGSEVLPHIHRTSEFAEAGTVRHWYLEHVGKIGAANALAQVPDEHREMCEAIDLEGLPTNLASEVAFAYDWRTGEARELGRGLHRNYSDCGPDEIPGTIDVVGLSPDLLYVGDYKGWQLVKANDNAQLLFAALCGTKVFDRSSAVVEIINVRGGNNWRSKATVGFFDLEEFAETLRTTMLTIESMRIEGTEPAVSEGDHCKYCPAFDSCPAKTKMLLAIAGGDSIPTLNPETALDAYKTFRAMKALVDVAAARIYAYAAQNPIDLGDGRVFGEHSKLGRESIDGDAAYELLRERLGQEFADVAVSRKATKTGLARAVRAAKARGVLTGTQKSENESILTELRATGAATSKKTIVVEEYKPKPAALP